MRPEFKARTFSQLLVRAQESHKVTVPHWKDVFGSEGNFFATNYVQKLSAAFLDISADVDSIWSNTTGW